MKKLKNVIIFLISFLLSLNVFSQEIKFNDLKRGESKPKTPFGGWKIYISKDGITYNADDIIKIGLPSSIESFAFITRDGHMNRYPKSYSGKEVRIKYFIVTGFKNSGFEVVAICRGSFLDAFYIDMENAIQTGEIKSFGMTSDEALSELKKAKDKLDLGLITQAQYDSLKIEYKKFIKM